MQIHMILQVSVPEEAGVIRLLVVRAQGLTGMISVEWRTQDGTAVSAGKNPPDFQVRFTCFFCMTF